MRLHVVLPMRLFFRPTKRGSQLARAERMALRVLHTTEEASKLKRNAMFWRAIGLRLVCEGVDTRAHVRTDEERLKQRVQVAGRSLVVQAHPLL